MTEEQYLLTILIEECNETAQRATKALIFGLQEIQPEQPLTNAERIIYEFNDIIAIMELLMSRKLMETVYDGVAIGLKKIKIEKYLEYSKECGTLTD